MKSMPPVTTPLTPSELEDRFIMWRSNKKRKSEPVPLFLIEHLKKCCDYYGLEEVKSVVSAPQSLYHRLYPNGCEAEDIIVADEVPISFEPTFSKVLPQGLDDRVSSDFSSEKATTVVLTAPDGASLRIEGYSKPEFLIQLFLSEKRS